MQERAKLTRNAIVIAAADLIARNGIFNTTFSRVSKTAHITAGAIHFHFASKEALLEEIVADAIAQVQRAFSPALESDSPLIDVIVDTTFQLNASLTLPTVVRAGVRISAEAGSDVASPVQQAWIPGYTALFEKAQAQGLLADGVSPVQTARTIVYGLIGLQMQYCPKKNSRAEIYRQVSAVLETTLLASFIAPAAEEGVERARAEVLNAIAAGEGDVPWMESPEGAVEDENDCTSIATGSETPSARTPR